MPQVRFQGRTVALHQDETVLQALLREGMGMAHSCRTGVCQSCLARCVEGAPPAASQAGLKDTLRQQGYFLPCICRPTANMTIALPQAGLGEIPAVIVRIESLSRDVVRVLLEPLADFPHLGGQFLNLVRDDGLARAYSIASLPSHDRFLELHVRCNVRGRMSQWLAEAARPGERVRLRGPAGECVYVPGTPDQPLALIATGTGLAPLYAILRDALRHGHRGPIHLFHGARTAQGLYLVDELSALAGKCRNLEYVRCVLEGPAEPPILTGNLPMIVRRRLPQLAGHRLYLCGDPGIVTTLRKQAFMAGASLKQIHADAFISAVPAAP